MYKRVFYSEHPNLNFRVFFEGVEFDILAYTHFNAYVFYLFL